MQAPSAWQLYDQFLLQLGKKALDLSADTFKVALFLSTSDCGSKSHSTAKYSDFTHEVANGNGYTTGGTSAGVGSYTNSAGTQHFDVANVGWTASGGSIVARYAVLYDSTDANKRAVAFCVLDNTPADITILNGITVNLVITDVLTLVQSN